MVRCRDKDTLISPPPATRARLADAPWICFVDADVILETGFAVALSQVLAPGGYYRVVSGDGGIGGTFACSRTDFERVGGYDEVYRGWGEEDNDLYDVLQFIGLRTTIHAGSTAEAPATWRQRANAILSGRRSAAWSCR